MSDDQHDDGGDVSASSSALLGGGDVRALAARLGLRPTKSLGQKFVIDGGTIRRIVRASGVTADDVVLEVGPGLGSLTLGLLETGARVIAVELDPLLAAELPRTVADRVPEAAARLTVVNADALEVRELPAVPTAIVANLPYNVAVPVLLTLLSRFPSLRSGLVMVQSEVADRLAARPGSRTYGAPSAKAAWYAATTRAGTVGRQVFWPVPNVDSALVRLVRRPPPETTATREQVFACIDAAFAQRRKTLRAALAGWAGSSAAAERFLEAAGIDASTRGERLAIGDFAAIAERRHVGTASGRMSQ